MLFLQGFVFLNVSLQYVEGFSGKKYSKQGHSQPSQSDILPLSEGQYFESQYFVGINRV